MTCIVGLLDKSKVYIGGDTCGSNGYHYSSCDHPKVFRVGDFIIGGTTSFRMLDLLEYSLDIPFVKPSDEENMDKFMRTTFVNSVRDCLKKGGFCKIDRSEESGGTFLIAYKDKMYRMQDNFSIINRLKYDSVGCGMYAAIGSLHTTEGMKMLPEGRITVALEAAASIMTGVKGPFNILST